MNVLHAIDKNTTITSSSTSSNTMEDNHYDGIVHGKSTAVKDAKNKLLQILNNHGNVTSHPRVAAAVEKLNKEWIRCSSSSSSLSSSPPPVIVGEDRITNEKKNGIKSEMALRVPQFENNTEKRQHQHQQHQLNDILVKMTGEWTQISAPTFPNEIEKVQEGAGGRVGKSKNKAKYTLGRLGFNMFQPKKLLCTLEDITNTVRPHTTSSSTSATPTSVVIPVCNTYDSIASDETTNVAAVEHHDHDHHTSTYYTYDILQKLIVHTERGDLPATLTIEGRCHCHQNEKKTNRYRVPITFTAGEFQKSVEVDRDPLLRKLWNDTFRKAYATAEKERGYLSTFAMWLMKIAFQLTLPTDDDDESSDCATRYEMKRSPKGYIDILYLDEDLRVTRGNRGSVVIVKKTKD